MTNPIGANPTTNLWLVVLKLLRLRLIITISGFRHAKLSRKIGTAFLGLLFLAFLGFIFFVSWSLLRFLQSPDIAEYTGELSQMLESFGI